MKKSSDGRGTGPCGDSSTGRATAFQAVGCGFDSRSPLQGRRQHALRESGQFHTAPGRCLKARRTCGQQGTAVQLRRAAPRADSGMIRPASLGQSAARSVGIKALTMDSLPSRAGKGNPAIGCGGGKDIRPIATDEERAGLSRRARQRLEQQPLLHPPWA